MSTPSSDDARARSTDIAAALIALAVSIAYGAIGYSYRGEWTHNDPIGPSAYVIALGAAGVLASAWLAARSVAARRRPRLAADAEVAVSRPLDRVRGEFRVVLVMGLLAAYAGLLERLGFLLLTPVVISVVLAAMGARGRDLVVFPIAMTVAVYVVFVFGLNVPLPGGDVLPDFAPYRHYLLWR